MFVHKTWQLKQAPFDKDIARSTFKYSILYLMLLCTGMVVDSLPVSDRVIAVVTDNWNAMMSLIPTF
jgi:heme o synthase